MIDSLDLSLVHAFRRAGQAFLFDGASGALARLSDGALAEWQTYLSCLSRLSQDGGLGQGAGSETGHGNRHEHGCERGCERGPRLESGVPHPPGLARLAANGLFRRPPSPVGCLPSPGLHSLCLNVAHGCNLACTYCFAGGGGYGGGPGLMTRETARLAIDFLAANARPGRVLSVDFFGGEPLLAWDVVEDTVAYAQRRGQALGTGFRFSLTTNGTLVDGSHARFIARHMSTVIVSLDGRPEVHDRARPGLAGEPSYRGAAAGARAIAEALARERRSPGPDMPSGTDALWIRGTFTSNNRDFWRDVDHLVGEGFRQVSLEPVLAPPEASYALAPEDLPALEESYGHVLDMAVKGLVRFFHFELNADRPACAAKRFAGCGAGTEYACVAPGGHVYPCHQFDGEREFEMLRLDGAAGARGGEGGDGSGGGDSDEGGGGTRFEADERLAAAHAGSKAACRSCWAQLHCGGGCHYTAWRYGGGLHDPPQLSCDLLRLRLEHALALAALRAPEPVPDRIS